MFHKFASPVIARLISWLKTAGATDTDTRTRTDADGHGSRRRRYLYRETEKKDSAAAAAAHFAKIGSRFFLSLSFAALSVQS